MEVVTGITLDKIYHKFGLDFLRSISCQTPMMLAASIEMALAFEGIPYYVKHIIAGTFKFTIRHVFSDNVSAFFQL